MDYLKILKRAWEITWRYRALWVFGIILALTAGGGGGSGGGGGGGPNGDLETAPLHIPPEVLQVLLALAVLCACAAILITIVFTIARYVAETALIRMVNDYEETGEKLTVRQGFRAGWSRTAWRIFLISLLINAPLAIVFLILFLISLSPLLVWILTSEEALVVLGTIAALGMVFLSLMLAIITFAVADVLLQFFWRACALEGLGVFDAIRNGFAMVRRHLKNVAIMWVIMVGIRIGLAIVSIPIVIVLLIAGTLLGGLPALFVWGIARALFADAEAIPWVLAALVGLPVFVLVLALPMTFIGGLTETFHSTTWTLTYRELRALEQAGEEDDHPPTASEDVGEWPAA
ncbi:MAG: hypothetical protein N2508_04185 [Anaerolineae bacterium]|nr:hypothetical protein [Anaerolineae bacterium]